MLLDYYKMQVARSEHFENQLLSIVRLHFTLVAGLLVVAGYDRMIGGTDDLVIGLVVVLVGAMGLSCVKTYSYRSIRHGRTARECRRRLDELHGCDFESARQHGKTEARQLLKLGSDPSIRRVWRSSYYVVIGIGLMISVTSVYSLIVG